MKKILVAGAYGQLGTAIQRLSNDITGYSFLFHDIDTLDLTDFRNLNDFIKNEKPDYIINCSAYNAVDKAETDKENAVLLNVQVPEKLAQFASENNATLFHVSTDYVFDGKHHLPYTEDDQVCPVSAYGESKARGEEAVLGNGNHFVIRTSWLYSASGNNFLKTVLRLAEERDELRMIFDQIGTPTYAPDLADAILQIIKSIDAKIANPLSGCYHYSNEGVGSWYDFAKAIVDETGTACCVLPIETHEYPLPAKRPYYSVLNKSKIKRNFGIQIPHWRDSLRLCIKELKKAE